MTRQEKNSTDLNRREALNQKTAKSYAKSLANGGAKKQSGGDRLSGKYLKYIPEVKERLESSLLFFGALFADRRIPVDIDTIHYFWDLVCKREHASRPYIMKDGLRTRESEFANNGRMKYAQVEYLDIRGRLCETEGCSKRAIKIKSELCTLTVSEADKQKFQALKKQSKSNKVFAEIILQEFYQRIGTGLPATEAEVDPLQVTTSTSFITPKPDKKKQSAAVPAEVTPEV